MFVVTQHVFVLAVNKQFPCHIPVVSDGVKTHVASAMANPLRGEVIRLYKTVSKSLAHINKARLCPVMDAQGR